jgi:hypothetical protein
MRLRDYPYIVVRFSCRHCPRIGRYRVAVLAERYGADIEMDDLLEEVSSSFRVEMIGLLGHILDFPRLFPEGGETGD